MTIQWDKVKAFLIATGLLLGAILIVTLLISQVIMPLLVGRAQEVQIPDLRGINIDQANKDCNEINLFVHVDSYELHETYPSGAIISQDPIGGKMMKVGGTVDVIVSKGPEQVIVPKVIKLPVSQAVSRIKNVSLNPITSDYRNSDSIAVNEVISSWPIAGKKVARGSSVYLTISRGPFVMQTPEAEQSQDEGQ